jgi:hypothetical protein
MIVSAFVITEVSSKKQNKTEKHTENEKLTE